ncbi:hypothetical protein RHGRI_029756 [Rhododendron griersonianum]|uniref:Secreted protein n=1 Tax=Rhododendron griersonianum TaxID=479676 RepID=A0AAV6IKM9_9ERIC|nr:hypothetical protein RHGRI_029756 [Rhododendron griersonianum]
MGGAPPLLLLLLRAAVSNDSNQDFSGVSTHNWTCGEQDAASPIRYAASLYPSKTCLYAAELPKCYGWKIGKAA